MTSRPIDPILKIFVGIVERSDPAEIGITLFLPGGVISGRLVGHAEWLRTFEEAVRGAESGLGTSLAAGVNALLDNYKPNENPEFICVKAAHIVAGIFPMPEGLFRARLADVCGFTLGEQ